MTRINLGINPSELCNEMLLGEYKELPRTIFHAKKRIEKHNNLGDLPKRPTLGIGHVMYFLNYGGSLKARFKSIVEEMKYRDFYVGVESLDLYDISMYIKNDNIIPNDHVEEFIPEIKNRITYCLFKMKRVPTWTNRNPSRWILNFFDIHQHNFSIYKSKTEFEIKSILNHYRSQLENCTEPNFKIELNNKMNTLFSQLLSLEILSGEWKLSHNGY